MYCENCVNTSAFSHGASRILAVVAGADSIGMLVERAALAASTRRAWDELRAA
jgi:hypothetical protein